MGRSHTPTTLTPQAVLISGPDHIDIRAHVFPDRAVEAAMPALKEEAGMKVAFDGTIASLAGAMDAGGVGVIQSVAIDSSQVRGVNDWAAKLAGERIVPFAGIHSDLDNLGAVTERMTALGLRGIKTHPEYQHCRPDDDRMAPTYEGALRHGSIILLHTGVDVALPTLHGTPEAFARALDTYFGVRFILVHMGGYELWDDVAEHLVGRDAHFDTAHSLGHTEDTRLLELVAAYGAERIFFGSEPHGPTWSRSWEGTRRGCSGCSPWCRLAWLACQDTLIVVAEIPAGGDAGLVSAS